MAEAQQVILDSDNEQAAQFQAERNKFQQVVATITAEEQKAQDDFSEVKANAVTTYSVYVSHRVAVLANSPLKNSAVAFVNKEQTVNRTQLLDTRELARSHAERQLAMTAAQRPSNIQQSGPVSPSANGAIPPQYFPGPDGIGGVTLPGLVSAQPPVVYAPAVQGYALTPPQIPAARATQLYPMHTNLLNPPTAPNFRNWQ